MKKIIYIVTAFIISSSAFAQKNTDEQLELDTGTIETQFDYIINKSTKFRDFQLIRKASILKVQTHTLDTIKIARENLVKANTSISESEKNISELEKEVTTLKNEVSSITKDVNSISFMGIDLSKTNYNMLVWSLITTLLLGLIVFILMFKKSNIDTKSAQSNLTKSENDFEAFRKKAMLKEQEVMRKLQDELNKNSH